MLHILFVNFFGPSKVTASIFNLGVISPFYKELLETISTRVGIAINFAKEDKEGYYKVAKKIDTELNSKHARGDSQIHQYYITLESLKSRGDHLYKHKPVWLQPVEPACLLGLVPLAVYPWVQLLKGMAENIAKQDLSPQQIIPPTAVAVTCTTLSIGVWRASMGDDVPIEHFVSSTGSRTRTVQCIGAEGGPNTSQLALSLAQSLSQGLVAYNFPSVTKAELVTPNATIRVTEKLTMKVVILHEIDTKKIASIHVGFQTN